MCGGAMATLLAANARTDESLSFHTFKGQRGPRAFVDRRAFNSIVHYYVYLRSVCINANRKIKKIKYSP